MPLGRTATGCESERSMGAAAVALTAETTLPRQGRPHRVAAKPVRETTPHMLCTVTTRGMSSFAATRNPPHANGEITPVCT